MIWANLLDSTVLRSNFRKASILHQEALVQVQELPKSVQPLHQRDLYPSLNHIKNYTTNRRIGAFVLNMKGVVSHYDKTIIDYQIIIDARESEESLQAYVLNPIYLKISNTLTFSRRAFTRYIRQGKCAASGEEFTNQFQAIEDEQENWMVLSHINDVLMNPNE